MYVQPGSLTKRPFKWSLMLPAWGVFGFVDSLRHHPSFPFICFVIRPLWEQELNVRCETGKLHNACVQAAVNTITVDGHLPW